MQTFFLDVISQGNCDRNFTAVCNGTILLFIVSTSQCNNIRENMVNITTLGLQENGGKHFNMLVFICHQNESKGFIQHIFVDYQNSIGKSEK